MEKQEPLDSLGQKVKKVIREFRDYKVLLDLEGSLETQVKKGILEPLVRGVKVEPQVLMEKPEPSVYQAGLGRLVFQDIPEALDPQVKFCIK